ncbi:hypothetical protein CB0940_06178 [Cercospora beticola]|uniref:Rhodopsin domain-containing protein n=1 Tax=Cercospora beticola TaxID=122368 RepID=A0A2G5I0C5_CERBT|nr:hypothetical protein CB0940_06178 [Cercospora beticola]PIA98254.1 hypothetical protein CB0940_06178 [Cercospora beticola]WPA98794.1 hypothetical protein RHO25_003407 [Cercospora beticola]CAK1360075.1 unnamed protein product [Cercospora beticola]
MKAQGHAPKSVFVTVVVVGSVLTWICTILRLWTRCKIHRQAGVDDVFITISLGFNIVMCIAMVMADHSGQGTHIWTMTPEGIKQFLFYLWLLIWNYYGAQGFAKLAILYQYLRIFGPVVSFRRACYVAIALSGFYTLWGIVTSMLICYPAAGFWHLDWQHDGRAHCMPMWKVKVPIWFFNAALNMTTDLLISIIPLPVISQLNLPRKQRYMLMGVFCLGGLVCVISIVRLSGLYAIATSDDPTYDNGMAAMWSSMEANLTAIASCLPVLKGLFSKWFPKLFKGTSNGTADRYASDFSGPNHSHLRDTETIGSSGRGVWGKKSTTIHVSTEESAMEEGSPGAKKSEAWGWSEPEAKGGAIQMHTIVERSGSKRKGAGPTARASDESGEALVPPPIDEK